MVLCAAALAETARWVVGRQVGLALRSVGHVGRDSTSSAGLACSHPHILTDVQIGPETFAELLLWHTHPGAKETHDHPELRSVR